MICHPNTIIELSIMRGEELQAESERYGHAARASQIPRSQTPPLVRVRAAFASHLFALRIRLWALADPETLHGALARPDHTSYP